MVSASSAVVAPSDGSAPASPRWIREQRRGSDSDDTMATIDGEGRQWHTPTSQDAVHADGVAAWAHGHGDDAAGWR
jgi:hypothetical protein